MSAVTLGEAFLRRWHPKDEKDKAGEEPGTSGGEQRSQRPRLERVWLLFVPGEGLGHLPLARDSVVRAGFCLVSAFFDFRPALVWTVHFIVTTLYKTLWVSSF